jgi:hypothetical protein
MKKHYYTAPECEIVRINLGNQILQGSLLGEEGEAGKELDVLPEFGF